MKSVNALMVLTGLLFLSGCFSTRQANFQIDQTKRPERIGIYYDSTVSGLKDSEQVVHSGVLENDLYNFIKAAMLECFGKAFIEVLEVPSPPPYKSEAFLNAGLGHILVVGVSEKRFKPPLILAIEGYRVRVTLDYTLYSSDGIASISGTASGKAYDRFPFLRFSGKKIFSKVCNNAVGNAVLKLRTEVFREQKE